MKYSIFNPTWCGLFGLLLALGFAGTAEADKIQESNYQHIDPKTAVLVDGVFEAHLMRGRLVSVPGVRMASALSVDAVKGVSPLRSLPRRDTVALVFDNDICAIGFQLALPPRAESNSIPVEIRFVSRDGEVVDTLTRRPALGTTRQAYESTGFDQRFAAVQISARTMSEMAVADIRALPCNVPIS